MLAVFVSLAFALFAVILGAVLAAVGGASLDLNSVVGAAGLVALTAVVAVASLVSAH